MAENNMGLATINVREAMSAGGQGAYSSMRSGTMKEKAALYNAMSNPAHKVGDYINKTIRIKDIYVENIELTDEETGEMSNAVRTVLIDVEGDTYQAVSQGVFRSLARLIETFGEPTWEDGIPCVVRQISLGRNQMLTLEVDVEAI